MLLFAFALIGAPQATTYSAACPPGSSSYYTVNTDWARVTAAGTARSMALAGLNGTKWLCAPSATSAYGSGVILNCASLAKSAGYAYRSAWPNACPIYYMAQTLNNFTTVSGTHPYWLKGYNGMYFNEGVNAIGTGLASYHSPSLIPMWGQMDHWVDAYELDATSLGAGSFTLHSVSLHDMATGSDSARAAYQGTVVLPTWFFDWVYTPIASTGDPNYTGHYVTFYDPPTTPSGPHQSFTPDRRRGLDLHGMALTTDAAEAQVWEALRLARMDQTGAWEDYEYGEADAAAMVVGVTPAGVQLDYALVPILDEAGDVLALVTMASEDGAVQSVFVPEEPFSYVGLDQAGARQAARALLRGGERLTTPELTWDYTAGFSNTPQFPYFEAGVLNSSGFLADVIRVSLVTGEATRQSARSLAPSGK